MLMADAFRDQAAACGRLGSPMYAALLGRLADDIDAGGPSRDVLAGHEDDPGPSALALRLLGSVHRLVLQRRAGELATCYPSVGGTWDVQAAWPALLSLFVERGDEVREWLDRPPQTNEVGRSAALMGGLLRLGERHRLPVRLLEIGSSGGLNLLADRFGYRAPDGSVLGRSDSPLVLENAWQGRDLVPWPDLEVVERLGSDVMPVDVSTTEGRLTLTAYVWPDQAERHERLRRAFAIAAESPVQVLGVGARPFVESAALAPGTTTVLWHSVMWQYLHAADQDAILDRIEQLGAAATEDMPFAHLFAEPTRRTPDAEHEFLVVLQSWPGGGRRILGATVGHGIPTTWE